MWWQEKLTTLRGIGPRRAQEFHNLNIETVGDLLEYFPRQEAYIDQSCLKNVAELTTDGTRQLFRAQVVRALDRVAGSGRRYGMLTLGDSTGYVELYLFGGQRYLTRKFTAGRQVLVSGKVKPGRVTPVVTEPIIQDDDPQKREAMLGVLPVYSLSGDLTQHVLREAMRQALERATEAGVPETLPPELLQKYQLPGRLQAYQHIHFPPSLQAMEAARRRFIYEELFLLQCGLLLERQQHADMRAGVRHAPDGKLLTQVRAQLPFTLTPAQGKAWREIAGDMERPVPMHRLLQGDVGSGKTVLAALALAKTAENGYQGVIMAPTGILARQHYETLQQWFAGTPVRVALLTSSTKAAERRQLLLDLQLGLVHILIGTHAVLQEDVEIPKLALIVTDEQHRFGVNQRATLVSKSPFAPDVLIMTATPIPRTLALTLYGDVDVSLMRGKPPGRREVTTLCYLGEKRQEIYAGMVRQVQAGRQAYVVCATIDEQELPESAPHDAQPELLEGAERVPLRSATQVYAELKRTFLKNIPCALLHGRMKNAEKEAIMEAFAAGELKVLITTTVIEVGVNVPNATLMVVENADRYGLAQLHQLRGRTGRGQYQSYCVLVTDSRQPEAWERLQILRGSSDGFALAEQDLRLRGSGMLFGLRQHGLPDLHIADILRDVQVLQHARVDAQAALAHPAQREALRKAVEAQFDHRFEAIFNF